MRDSDDALTVVGLMLEAHRGLVQRLAAVHQQHQLQGKEFDMLLRVLRAGDEGHRMSDLAAQTGTSTSGVTSIVDRLESRGLLHRRPHGTDRRSTVVSLTPAGRRLVDADLAALHPVIEEALSPLGSEQANFAAALRRLRDHLTPNATDRHDAAQ